MGSRGNERDHRETMDYCQRRQKWMFLPRKHCCSQPMDWKPELPAKDRRYHPSQTRTNENADLLVLQEEVERMGPSLKGDRYQGLTTSRRSWQEGWGWNNKGSYSSVPGSLEPQEMAQQMDAVTSRSHSEKKVDSRQFSNYKTISLVCNLMWKFNIEEGIVRISQFWDLCAAQRKSGRVLLCDIHSGWPLSPVLFNMSREWRDTLPEHHTSLSIGGNPLSKPHFADDIDLIAGSHDELQALWWIDSPPVRGHMG